MSIVMYLSGYIPYFFVEKIEWDKKIRKRVLISIFYFFKKTEKKRKSVYIKHDKNVYR